MSASGCERIASTARAAFPATSPILQLSWASNACVGSSSPRHSTPCADRTRISARAENELVNANPLVGGMGPSEVAGSECRTRHVRQASEQSTVIRRVDSLGLRVETHLGDGVTCDREYLLTRVDLGGRVIRGPGPRRWVLGQPLVARGRGIDGSQDLRAGDASVAVFVGVTGEVGRVHIDPTVLRDVRDEGAPWMIVGWTQGRPSRACAFVSRVAQSALSSWKARSRGTECSIALTPPPCRQEG